MLCAYLSLRLTNTNDCQGVIIGAFTVQGDPVQSLGCVARRIRWLIAGNGHNGQILLISSQSVNHPKLYLGSLLTVWRIASSLQRPWSHLFRFSILWHYFFQFELQKLMFRLHEGRNTQELLAVCHCEFEAKKRVLKMTNGNWDWSVFAQVNEISVTGTGDRS